MKTRIAAMFCALCSMTATAQVETTPADDLAIVTGNGVIIIHKKTLPIARLTDKRWDSREKYGIPLNAVRCGEYVFGAWEIENGIIELQLHVLAATSKGKLAPKSFRIYVWSSESEDSETRWISQRAPAIGGMIAGVFGEPVVAGYAAVLPESEGKLAELCLNTVIRPSLSPPRKS